MKFRIWALGLLHAAIAGAASAAAAALADPAHFNLSPAGLAALGKMSATGALVGLVMYLKQSPLPARTEPAGRPRPAE